jgi:hypothetical protein
MENFDLNKLYYDKDGTKLYGHDMVRLAINHLFIKQRTGFLKFCFWSVIGGFLAFFQSYLMYVYNIKITSAILSNASFFIAIVGILWGACFSILLIIHGISYSFFMNSDEFKQKVAGLDYYKRAFKKMSSTAKKQLIDKAKQTILNTPHIRQNFERQFKRLSALNSAINQTTNNASQATSNMAYTAHQQIYNGFDSLNFGNNNNKNNSII